MDNKLKKFIIKYSLISALFIWAIGSHFKDFTKCVVESLIHPFMSMDLDQNGQPDLIQLKQFKITILNITFPIGKLFLAIINFVAEISLVLFIIWLFIKYSKLIKL